MSARALITAGLAALALGSSGCALGSEEPTPRPGGAAADQPAPPGGRPAGRPAGGASSSPRPAAKPAPGGGDTDTLVGAQTGVAVPYIAFGDRPFQPRVIEATEDAVLTGVAWSRWGSATPAGTGSVRVNTCDPSCAEGKIERRGGARIELSRLRTGTCDGRSARFYTRARISWPKGLGLPGSQSVKLSPRCV